MSSNALIIEAEKRHGKREGGMETKREGEEEGASEGEER